MYQKIFKPFLDKLAALFLIVVFSPLFILVIIFLYFANGGKVFFAQRRNGYKEKEFVVIKFRTMNEKRDHNGELLSDSERLTRVGRFVRRTSLDEMPQLFNILIGDMSFIGPRPLLLQYFPYFTQKERLRFTVKPGITGLAQVSGRNMLGWDKRLELDVDYVTKISFRLDVKIFVHTIRNVVTSKDIVVDPESIMLNLDDERRLKN